MGAIDFQFDQAINGRAIKLLDVVDEFTRETLAMEVATSITADDTVKVLDRLARERSARGHVRCDNGPELTAHALRDWCRFSKAETAFIEPGAPWQNPFVESFNGRVRDELLDVEQFCLAEARVVIADWRDDYNHRRPHSALAMKAPAVFAASWTAADGRARTSIRCRQDHPPDSHRQWTEERGPVNGVRRIPCYDNIPVWGSTARGARPPCRSDALVSSVRRKE